MNIQNYTFITAANMGDVCPVFRRRFLVHKQIQQAALEITALGVYVAELNGTRIGDLVLARAGQAMSIVCRYRPMT